MSDFLRRLREYIYQRSLAAGLFLLIPVAIRLPAALSDMLMRLKAAVRFSLGSYRAYVNRPGLREIAVKNFMDAFGTDREAAKRAIRLTMRLEVYSERNGFLFDSLTLPELEKEFAVEGLENLDRALKHGTGVVFATVHSGDTVFFMLLLALKGYNVYGLFDGGIMERPSSNPLERLAKLKDDKITGRIGKLYAGKGLKATLDALRGNGIIIWMVDLPAGSSKRKTLVNFLGSNISVDSSFCEVAARCGSVILPHVSAYDHGKGRHVVRIGEPLEPDKSAVPELFGFFEERVREYPESWIGWYIFDLLQADAYRGSGSAVSAMERTCQ